MQDLQLMIFICTAAPLSMMLGIFRDRARILLGFLITGLFMCLFAGEINGLLRNNTGLSVFFLTVNVTPIIEEILKALPIILLAFLIKPERQLLIESSIATGVGFATFENICFLFDSTAGLSAGTIIARGFGTGMMHGISTLAVGYSMTFVSRNRRLSHAGTVAALSVAIIYHSVYNIMVQSDYPILGILLPVISYIPLIAVMNRYFGRKRKADTEEKTEQ